MGLIIFFSITFPLKASTSYSIDAPDQIIIQFKNEINIQLNDGIIIVPDDLKAINQKYGVTSIKPVFDYIPGIKTIKTKFLQRSMRVANTSFKEKNYNFKNFFILSFPKNTDIQNAVSDYKNNANIISAEPNIIFYYHFNPKKSDQISTDYQQIINAQNIQRISLGSPNIIIAVIDSGADITNPSLFNRIWINKKEKINNIDDDSNGFIDDINGYNFQNFSNNITDDNGHGTFISGIIGALPIDNTNVHGIENRYSPIMPVKITSKDGRSNVSTLCAGLFYSIKQRC